MWFLKRYFPRIFLGLLERKERDLIDQWGRRENTGSLDSLVEFLTDQDVRWNSFGLVTYSPGGAIRVENDIYGYEVTIRGGELLDCCPEYYGLDREQANKLMEAILSNIPGSIFFRNRIEKGNIPRPW